MSVQKTSSNLQQLSEEEVAILQKCKDLAKDVNRINTDLLGHMTPIDAVALNIEEYALIKEFRNSKLNFRLEKVKFIKEKVSKMLKF